ncbi:hypothetical protein [Polaromonas sp. AET17H-212]|uniref:hypothetical protein n=1 Tax=Polaromonas sp. AET17H-212 TaxID=1977061 RepID=UPI001596F81F|nr:hypothetical protein [Polaromonas sp. AET17H-212]
MKNARKAGISDRREELLLGGSSFVFFGFLGSSGFFSFGSFGSGSFFSFGFLGSSGFFGLGGLGINLGSRHGWRCSSRWRRRCGSSRRSGSRSRGGRLGGHRSASVGSGKSACSKQAGNQGSKNLVHLEFS